MAQRLGVIDRNAAVVRARELRRSPTLPEGLLWRVLRKRPGGFKFRRQHPIGPYVADFYCAAAKVVVEVDGESHRLGDRPQKDEQRDEWMRMQGLRVARFGAADVMRDLESVVTAITRACRS